MKAFLFSIGISLLLIACNNNKDYGRYETAIDNARNYLRDDLGDAANYEEVSWGTPEPRKVEWSGSARYKLYQDTIVMMQDHLKMMNDSLEAEIRLSGAESPTYKTMLLRRDGYQMYFTTYSNEVERLKAYDADPEYRGYWIYHEYNMDGSLKKVRIIYDDTLNWKPSELIYVE
jgi:hypothetical protein